MTKNSTLKVAKIIIIIICLVAVSLSLLLENTIFKIDIFSLLSILFKDAVATSSILAKGLGAISTLYVFSFLIYFIYYIISTIISKIRTSSFKQFNFTQRISYTVTVVLTTAIHFYLEYKSYKADVFLQQFGM